MTNAKSTIPRNSQASSSSVFQRLPLSITQIWAARSRMSRRRSTAWARLASMRNTPTSSIISSRNSLRISPEFSWPPQLSMASNSLRTGASALAGKADQSAPAAYSAALIPHCLPNTRISTRELVPRRLAP